MHVTLHTQVKRKSKEGNLQVYTWSNSFQRDAEIQRTKGWRSLAAKGKWLSWRSILGAVKSQWDDYESADRAVAMAWEAAKLVVF